MARSTKLDSIRALPLLVLLHFFISKDDAIARSGSFSGEKSRIRASVEINENSAAPGGHALIDGGQKTLGVCGNDTVMCDQGQALAASR